MLKSLVINKYISKDFLKIIVTIVFAFSCLSTVTSLFEEINFFKETNVGILLPLFMSVLMIPNLIYTLFPFIIFLSAVWLFLKLIQSDEIIAIKTSGRSNISIIIIPCIVAFFLGTLVITAFSPLTSLLVEKYENIKGNYSKDKEYLAAITANGIWIKEKREDVISIVRSSNLKDDYLMNVSIYQYDLDHNFVSRIEAKSAYIKTTAWILKNVRQYRRDENIKVNVTEEIIYNSLYDIAKIRTLYSNLDTVSFWGIKNQIQILKDRGYSTSEMQAKYQKTISFPFFLVSMVLLASVFTLGKTYKKNNWGYVFIAIGSCVFIYFFNDFSLALGKTEKISIGLSVWIPVIVVFLFSFVGLIHINEK